MTTYLDRYLGGEYEAVWAELQALGPAVRAGSVAGDARAVARETMLRARANVVRLAVRLVRIGYQFERGTGGVWVPNVAVYAPPLSDIGRRLDALERATGPLPLALRAWSEVVGEVTLLGRHPDWDERAYPDPLVVEGLDGWMYEYDDWREERAGGRESGPFVLSFAPDYYTKADVSGEPYGIALPCLDADAPLTGMWRETTFVAYLRDAFRWGGMPGWQRLDLGQFPAITLAETVRPTAHLAYLTDGLLPL